MRIQTHATVIFAIVLSTVFLAGCQHESNNREANEAFANLVGGAGEAAQERREAADEARKKKQQKTAFRRGLKPPEGEGDSGSGGGGGGSTGH